MRAWLHYNRPFIRNRSQQYIPSEIRQSFLLSLPWPSLRLVANFIHAKSSEILNDNWEGYQKVNLLRYESLLGHEELIEALLTDEALLLDRTTRFASDQDAPV